MHSAKSNDQVHYSLMRRFFSSLIIVALLLPAITHAEMVPERVYWRNFVLHMINASRAENSLLPVGIDNELTGLSQSHADDTALVYDDESKESRRATYLQHYGPNGEDLQQRIIEQNIVSAVSFGENVGFRYKSYFDNVHAEIEESLRYMHDFMMAEVPPDDGHRVTILNNYTHVGIGLSFHKKAGENQNTIFLVTDFGRFIDGREVSTPDVGSPPVWTASSTVEEESVVPTDKGRRSQRRELLRRMREREAAKALTKPQITKRTEEIAKPLSLRERRLARVAARRAERLRRRALVEERRMKRLMRRGLLQ